MRQAQRTSKVNGVIDEQPGRRHNDALAFRLLRLLKGTPFHPEWLSDRFHLRSRLHLRDLPPGKILDIGSGDSDQSCFLPDHGRTVRLDFPPTNEHYRIKPDLYGDACQLPVATGCIDIVLLLEVLEHVTDEVKAIQEVVRVLGPSGRLCLSVPFIYPLHDLPNDFRRFTIQGLRLLLQRYGLLIDHEYIHGNSIVSALQLLNLSLLEIAYGIYLKRRALGVLVGILVYPLCMIINLAAWPFIYLPGLHRSCFGYFVIARRA